MEGDVRRIIIESSVRRALSRAKSDPKRALRNLVDLAVESSSGVVQYPLFASIQDLLARDTNNAYYELLQRILTDVDTERLISFGMNLGYEGCTKGAERIRANEQTHGFNIPWALSIELPRHADTCWQPTAKLIDEARGLGVHVFLVYAREQLADALKLAGCFPDCAFFVFTRACAVNARALKLAEITPHALISVRLDDNDEPAHACARLRAHHMLYSVHIEYPNSDRRLADVGHALSRALAYAPHLVLFVPLPQSPPALVEAMGDWVFGLRLEQRYPMIAGDVFADRLRIDRAISNDQCACGIDADGRLVLFDGAVDNPACNAYRFGLAHVLAQMFPKPEAFDEDGLPSSSEATPSAVPASVSSDWRSFNS